MPDPTAAKRRHRADPPDVPATRTGAPGAVAVAPLAGPRAPGPAPAAPQAPAGAPERATARPEIRRRTTTLGRTDYLAVLGAAVGGVSLTAVLFSQVAPFTGALGFVVVSYLIFVGSYALLVSMDESGPAVRDRVVAVVVHSLAFLLLVALGFVIVYVFARGWTALHHLNFFTQDLHRTGPKDPLDRGGILHGAIGTLEQISISLAIVIPLGLFCAVYLSEVPGPLARVVRTISEAMTALPSIVAGLFVYATLIIGLRVGGFTLRVPKSGVAASLALGVMMLPIIIRAADVVLRLVPGSLKEASLALGTGQWRTVWHVVLPTARSGLVTAIVLGTARGVGETSPVLLTAGFTATLNTDPANNPQVSLPLLTFNLVRSGEPLYVARGFGAGATLMTLVLVLFVLARVAGGRGAGQLTAGQRRRRVGASRRHAERYAQRRAPRAAAGHERAAQIPTYPSGRA